MTNRRSRLLLWLAPAAFFLALSTRVDASPTTYQFRGVVVTTNSQTALSALGASIGDVVTVTLTVDPELAVDINPTPNTGVFVFASSQLTATVNGHLISAAGLYVIVGNDVVVPDTPLEDFVSIYGTGPFSSPASPFEIDGLVVGLTSSDSSLWDGGDFVIPVDLAPFDQNRSLSISMRNLQDLSDAIVTVALDAGSPGPAEQVLALVQSIRQMSLSNGTANSLNAKLGAAVLALDRNQHSDACGGLNAFTNEVRAQSGKKLSAQQADTLLTAGSNLLLALGCF